MNLQTNLRLLLAFFELLSESKHPDITAKDSNSVLIGSHYHIKLVIEQEEVVKEKTVKGNIIRTTETVRHKKITINDYSLAREAYAYVTKEDIDPNFESLLIDLLKRVSGDFNFITE